MSKKHWAGQDDHLPINADNLPYIEHDGVRRVLAALPPTRKYGSMQPFEATNPILPQSQWQEIEAPHEGIAINDQGQTSSCTAHGTTKGMEICVYKQRGELIRLNPYFLYAIYNGGRDAGAQVSDSLDAAEKYGCCVYEDLPQKVIFKNQLTEKLVTDATRFKIESAFTCSSFEAICSAISQSFVIPLGIYVGQNFSHIDSDGVCPLPNGGGGGHEVLGIGLKKHSRYGWLIKIVNSWGAKWAMNGYAYIHKGFFDPQVDAFAIQYIAEDPKDPVQEPTVPTTSETEEQEENEDGE